VPDFFRSDHDIKKNPGPEPANFFAFAFAKIFVINLDRKQKNFREIGPEKISGCDRCGKKFVVRLLWTNIFQRRKFTNLV